MKKKKIKKETKYISKGRRDIIVLKETKYTNEQWIAETGQDSKYYAKGYSAILPSNGLRGIIVLVKKSSGLNVKHSQIISLDII
jgi:exonuclease III